MRATLGYLAATIALAGCAQIQHGQVVEQPTGQRLMAGPGDLVLKITKHKDLQNAFGRADIFGRQTDEGYSELRFAGVEPDGTVVLFRRDVDIVSNETTMSRTPISHSFVSGTANNGYVSGYATTIAPPSDYHVVVPAETVPVRVPKGTSTLLFEGNTIEILGAAPTMLSYQIAAGVAQ